MNAVFLKTRELGEALLESDEYKAMKAAEGKAMRNPEAAKTMGQYLEIRQQVEKLLVNEQPDTLSLKRLSDEMDQLQERLQGIDEIAALTQAREDFSGLIEQVNQVLKFIVTGEMSEDGGDCPGSCAGCGGSCHSHGLN